jgi:Arc/MetJ family transcription regulator
MNPNVKRTSFNVDMELLAVVRKELGTRTMTDTIHAALREVIRDRRLRRLADRDFSSLTPDKLDEIRRARSLEAEPHSPAA